MWTWRVATLISSFPYYPQPCESCDCMPNSVCCKMYNVCNLNKSYLNNNCFCVALPTCSRCCCQNSWDFTCRIPSLEVSWKQRISAMQQLEKLPDPTAGQKEASVKEDQVRSNCEMLLEWISIYIYVYIYIYIIYSIHVCKSYHIYDNLCV